MAPSHWHTSAPPLPPPSTPLPTLSTADTTSLAAHAASLHDAECTQFAQTTARAAGGKGASEMSALTLMVQASPVHNAKALETLRGMAERGKGKGGRDESLKALRCISDWWTGGGAPDRKLRYFRDQPLTHPDRTDEHLILWHFEDWLKKYFFSVLSTLETLSLDPLPYVRTQALTLIATLLRDKPEQEHNLLRLLVNKLGDPEKSICSRASFHILQILQKHPSMKSIIVREVTSVVFHTPSSSSSSNPSSSHPSSTPANKHIRFGDDSSAKKKPNSKAPAAEKKVAKNGHVQYYAVITLNQIVLSPADQAVALQLINIYFDIFRQVLGSDSPTSTSSKNSTKPDEDEDNDTHEVKVDAKGRIRGGNDKDKGKKGKKGGETEYRGAAGFVEVEDSNSKLVSAILTGVNRALPFAKLHTADSDVYKHIDTLFAITHKSTFNTSLQAMVLIQQIASSLSTSSSPSPSSTTTPSTPNPAKSVIDRYHRTFYASLHDPRLSTSSKQAMYLNLLFKTLKSDSTTAGEEGRERTKAVVRRFVQVLVAGGSGATEFVAGGLYLLGELFSTIPGLRTMLNAPPKKNIAEKDAYDPKKRDPQWAHAGSSPLWELTPLLHSHHPAIALHARQLLTSQPLTASPDLSQNTLSHFLDRFVYKNAKTRPKAGGEGKGASAMQPAASALEGVKLRKGEQLDVQRVNERGFVERREGDVAVEEVFFWRFFKERGEREERMRRKVGGRKGEEDNEESEKEDNEDEEDEESEKEDKEEEEDSDVSEGELDEDEVWKAMQASMPKANGDDDLLAGSEDSDDLDSDMDAEMADSDSEGEWEDEDEDEDEEDAGKVSDDEDEDGLSLVEGSDNEDLISLDGDVPEGLIAYEDEEDKAEKDEEEEEEWGGVDGGAGQKRKRAEREEKKESRKKLRALPTFASYEDYAKLIDASPEDDI
ncbi:CBF-domain-containing protein [Ephemerocybe angulata]|uniref:CBF-domain-containing protein n=1 Tax=Ephemerocybe angulata TaxID=980116 RepID=A0A8H6M9Z3_9AGAR|nr:CBF-domain-containing protein [Tulosesus angulatus]